MDSPATTIKIYSELGRLADAIGEDRYLRIWYGLRLLDDGRGWLTDGQQTRRELLALGVAPSQQALRKLLRAGDGVWWHLDRGHGKTRTIAISGLKAISIYVARTAQQKDIPDIDRLPGRAIEVPVGALGGSLLQWRSMLAQVWVAGSKDQQRRVDWSTLEACWQRSRNTLRGRFERRGVSIIHNYAVLPLSALQPNSGYHWGKLPSAAGCSRTIINGIPYLLWQRPNTYRAGGQQAAKGMTRKVHRAVKHALAIPPRAYAQRQYYQQANAFGKARNRYFDLELYLLAATRPWGQFWEVAPAYQ